jgi:hypothetical protein
VRAGETSHITSQQVVDKLGEVMLENMGFRRLVDSGESCAQRHHA